jgi:hypothetical protein
MRDENDERLKKLLRSAMPPMAREAEPALDLWPTVRGQLHATPRGVPWFDWALVGGLVVLAAVFPASIPLFLYYL